MEIQKEYDKISGDYSEFLKDFKRIVEKILAKNKIPLAFEIASRLKTSESIIEKHESQRFVIKKTITELDDLVGMRIVLLFNEYKENVIEILSKSFKLVQYKKSSSKNVSQFGYSSTHLIVRIKEEWLSTPDWMSHGDKKIEIQIRTLSEHIWAETSHSLFYKREENIPEFIKRDLYRLSAVLEVVDEKVQSLRTNVTTHFQYIEKCPYEDILTMDLFPETFRRVMAKNSNGVYDLDEKKNKLLSFDIENRYNIINCAALDSIISNKIEMKGLDSSSFIARVLKLLEVYKMEIEEKQKPLTKFNEITIADYNSTEGRFEITKRSNGDFQFVLKAANGEIILNSEGYSSQANCLNGVHSVRRNGGDINMYQQKRTTNGKFYFILAATNGQIIGVSQLYESEVSCRNAIDAVRVYTSNSNIIVKSLIN